MVRGILAAGTLAATVCAADVAGWTPAAWTNESTVELCTTDAGEPMHCFPVWLVVLDGQLYVRLGTRAAGRVERSTTKPFLEVGIAGERFPHVHGIPAPDDAGRVADAMAAKYWSDLLVRYVNHPLTLRLVPE